MLKETEGYVNKIYHGNSLYVLKTFPPWSIDCVITSPPYWGLRDYESEEQIGMEKTFQEYIEKLCEIFDEIKRVLKKSGTCWLNLGDTYSHSGGCRSQYGKHKIETLGMKKYGGHKSSLPPKSLCMIPSRVAIELCNRGWILRNEIIWYKRNCMPSSVKDRFTVDFEKIFFFTKSKDYYFEQQLEPHLTKENRPFGIVREREFGYDTQYPSVRGFKTKGNNKKHHWKSRNYTSNGRNMRCIWDIKTKPSSLKMAHFATFPEDLVEIPLRAGCPVGGVVLDPFFGGGTVGVVALKQNKNFIGIELNKEYIKIAEKRLKPFLEQKRL